MVTIADVFRAQAVVRRHLDPTPLLHAPALSCELGCEVHFKLENQTPIRSFKARGALYRASRLESHEKGMACASTGNHGQGVAWAARLFGRRAVVVVPEGTTEQKVAAIRRLGADLRIYGTDLAEASRHARSLADDAGLVYCEDGEDQDVLAGCGTLALETVAQMPDFDDLLVPVGGGNLIAACALVLGAVHPRAVITGVQSEAAPAVYLAYHARRPVEPQPCRTFAGGLATTGVGSLAFPFIAAGVGDMVLVSEAQLLDAAAAMLKWTGQLPEGAAAAGLAALLADPARFAGRRVVVLLTGSNYEPAVWERVRGGQG